MATIPPNIPEGITASKQFPARWLDDREIEQKFVDQLLCQIVDDRAYLTFGQIRMPLNPAVPGMEIQIDSVAKLIVNFSALKRMLEVLNKLAAENIGED